MNSISPGSSVHSLVIDLRIHNRLHYWIDFGLSILVFWMLLIFASINKQPSLGWLAILPASFALYRSALFSHELMHFGKRSVPGFTAAWNILCGIPILMPAFMLRSHADHHGVGSYGTIHDPEYLPFATHPKLKRFFWLGSAMFPLVLLVKALLLVPISIILKPMRTWLHLHLRFMSMNSSYEPGRELQKFSLTSHWLEGATTLWATSLFGAILFGMLPWRFAWFWLACMTTANMLNAWRTLRAHRYTSIGTPMNFAEQLRDSTTCTLPTLLGELMYPVGQRFHAAHHLFPYLPYHALPLAHKRVIESEWIGLPDYRSTLQHY